MNKVAMLKSKTGRKNLDENGFASIVIALILIIVLSLLTVAFAQLARNEQQNSLNKELANQAYYAAESGINDAYSDIENGYITTANSNPNQCLYSVPNGQALINNQTIDSSRNVGYTCLLVNLSPPNIKYDNVAVQSERYITFTTSPQIDSLTFNWGSADAGGNTNWAPAYIPNQSFVPVAEWAHPALIQLSITPLNNLTRQALINNTFTAYFYPSATGANATAYNPTTAPVISGDCSTTNPEYTCSSTITGLAATGSTNFLVHFIDYYDASNVLINGTSTAPPQPVDFLDGQAQIDVTGRAQNVLKRLQVRVPLTPNVPLPNYAIEGQNICKRFDTYPGSTVPDNLPGCSLN